MAYGELDEYVSTASMRTDFQRLCDLGYRLECSECAGTTHVETALAVMGDSLRWARARLDGAAPDPTQVCVVQPPHCCTDSPSSVCTP